MFKCAAGHQTKVGVKQIRRVAEMRVKTYPARAYTAGGRSHVDPGGQGWETVREETVCPEHAGPVE